MFHRHVWWQVPGSGPWPCQDERCSKCGKVWKFQWGREPGLLGWGRGKRGQS